MIPEPSDEFGLWNAVKTRVPPWPDSNETELANLSTAWTKAGQVFDGGSRLDFSVVGQAWPDPAGLGELTPKLAKLTENTGRVIDSTQQQARYVAHLAEVVGKAKQGITDVIRTRAPLYGMRQYDPMYGAMQLQFAVDEVNRIMTEAEQAIGNADSGVAVQGPPGGRNAEYNNLQQYIFDEMIRNSNSDVVNRIRDNLSPGKMVGTEGGSLGGALGDWYNQVKAGGPWDHKQEILNRTAGDNSLTQIPGLPGRIRFDAWSNIHYGYVGREAGFHPDVLHAGANAADIKAQWRTDPADQAAIDLGIQLREKYGPGQLRPEHIREAIQNNWDDLVRRGTVVPN